MRGREAYGVWREIATRWGDNDVYGHVNNVVYYAYFDTVINRYLIDEGGLDDLERSIDLALRSNSPDVILKAYNKDPPTFYCKQCGCSYPTGASGGAS